MSAYAEGTIDSVNLAVDSRAVKAIIQDGSAFFSSYQGSVRRGSDGTPFVQLANVGTKGVAFGLLVEFMPMITLLAIKAAVETRLAAGEPFPIALTDDVHTIAVDAVPDFSQGNWITYPGGRLNGSYVKDVLLRFMSTS